MFRLIFIFSLSLLPLPALSDAYWSQGSEAIRDGATFIYADKSARLLWRKKLGDWVDKHGEFYGDTPFSTIQVKALDTSKTISIDMTALVKYWLSTPDNFQGVYLKALPGSSGTAVFNALEAGYPAAPFLAINTTTNEIKTFEVIRDTSLSNTSYYSLGHLAELKVGAQMPALLTFNKKFLQLDSAEITKASLFLSTTNQQFGNTQIGAYAVAPLPEAGKIERGIAWQYPDDRNLDDHPDVIVSEQFGTEKSFLNLNHSWQKNMSNIRRLNTYQLVDSDYHLDRFKPLDGNALQIAFNSKINYGFTSHYRFKQLMDHEPEQMYFRYYLRFGNSWQPVEGGKFPGFAGTYNTAGWGDRPIDGYNGWSARGAYFMQASPNSTYSGAIALGNYVYHLDSQYSHGEPISWNSTLNQLQKNRWYAIEQFLKLNDPGKANGQLTVWIDGRKIFDKTDLRFRKTTDLKIETLWMNFYHGGLSKPKSTYYLYIDNLVIASRYIGPMRPSSEVQ